MAIFIFQYLILLDKLIVRRMIFCFIMLFIAVYPVQVVEGFIQSLSHLKVNLKPISNRKQQKLTRQQNNLIKRRLGLEDASWVEGLSNAFVGGTVG